MLFNIKLVNLALGTDTFCPDNHTGLLLLDGLRIVPCASPSLRLRDKSFLVFSERDPLRFPSVSSRFSTNPPGSAHTLVSGTLLVLARRPCECHTERGEWERCCVLARVWPRGARSRGNAQDRGHAEFIRDEDDRFALSHACWPVRG